MSQQVEQLEPQSFWKHFAALNAVPRPSKKEERVIRFVREFGERLSLPTRVDEVGNVIITKPATPGMELKPTVILQSHLDMVCQKNSDTEFDFDNQGISMVVDGDFVRAQGTTLGADNGIGVAAIMEILESKDIAHPRIEALFTIDEETGMTGALGLKGGLLEGRIMLNLDTEDDRELTIGCAGGLDVTSELWYQPDAFPSDSETFEIVVRGLTGGHSGMDIHLGRGNANKLLNRLLWKARQNFGLRVSIIDGGGLRNAIPREARALVMIPSENLPEFLEEFAVKVLDIKTEYKTTDPKLSISCTPSVTKVIDVLDPQFQDRIIDAIYACPNGIHRMSPDITGLVQTSNNLARVLIEHGQCTVKCLTRSSVDTEKADLAQQIQSCFEPFGADVSFTGEYPGWTPNPHSPVVDLMARLYTEMFGEKPHVNACHAGLECGILARNYPGMDMVSFGPNIRGAHSPDENVQISSVSKFRRFFHETLRRVG
jgi:dipeptidase D